MIVDFVLSDASFDFGILPKQYMVYTIHDTNGRCCYVGMTRNPQKRMWQHRAGLSNVKTTLGDSDNLYVKFYTKESVDELAILRDELGDNPEEALARSADKDWAQQAEWFFCDEFRPYLNIQKGWPGELVRSADFLEEVGLSNRLEKVAYQVLEKWNPPFAREPIVNALLDGATLSQLAAIAGICSFDDKGNYPREEE